MNYLKKTHVLFVPPFNGEDLKEMYRCVFKYEYQLWQNGNGNIAAASMSVFRSWSK